VTIQRLRRTKCHPSNAKDRAARRNKASQAGRSIPYDEGPRPTVVGGLPDTPRKLAVKWRSPGRTYQFRPLRRVRPRACANASAKLRHGIAIDVVVDADVAFGRVGAVESTGVLDDGAASRRLAS
jgi:hypothetical protein